MSTLKAAGGVDRGRHAPGASKRLLVTIVLSGLLSACGGVKIHPEPALPKPLIVPIQSHVGLVIPSDMRSYTHKETRWGVDWDIALGSGHAHLMHDVFHDEFSQVEEFKDLDAARAAPDLKAIFEPRIDQYSFVTARETGGRYYAVTIRYRVDVYTPQGQKADSLTLTGYGNALAKGMSSGAPLERASLGAMRDAAAKFLVQFPDQAEGQRLARNEAVTVEKAAETADNSAQIEAVPIDDPVPDTAAVPPTQPAGTQQPAGDVQPAGEAHPAGDAPTSTPQATASGPGI